MSLWLLDLENHENALYYHNVDLEKAKLHQSEADLVLLLSTLTASLLVKVELICKFSAFMNSCIGGL